MGGINYAFKDLPKTEESEAHSTGDKIEGDSRDSSPDITGDGNDEDGRSSSGPSLSPRIDLESEEPPVVPQVETEARSRDSPSPTLSR